MVIIKNYKVKKLCNKFPEISGKIRINFRKFRDIFQGKFPEISELTTLLTLTLQCNYQLRGHSLIYHRNSIVIEQVRVRQKGVKNKMYKKLQTGSILELYFFAK